MAYLARFGRRFLYTSSVLRSEATGGVKHTIATPVPHTQTPLLNTPELQQVAQKATGHWKELSKEEFLQSRLLRAIRRVKLLLLFNAT